MALGLFNAAEVTKDFTVLQPVPFEEPVKRTRSGYKRKAAFKNIPQQDQVYKIEETQRNCPKCGDNISVVGKKFLRSEIKYIPAEISIVNIYQETYECRKCKKEGLPSFFNPYTPEPVLQHSYATASSVAWTMYQNLYKQFHYIAKKKIGSRWVFQSAVQHYPIGY
ncbi:zinc-finger binding domain of transposase IS66 [Proteiniborus ethanoligenes]|uniref:Zinc-finger binding domain of transposase IS66 n=1 Tax=Proteiniborus ethanoligenes TaxID=415015 RepID=A0A1H3SCZ2_9FIRM|nr:IS66 family transposase zinc-finger binding domain-containing protein [Proteiniborus ethanoligenes]SDZ35587.1 zinc-finger binding domain of transposase IS66 [Proteiniborus ethanoligenes]